MMNEWLTLIAECGNFKLDHGPLTAGWAAANATEAEAVGALAYGEAPSKRWEGGSNAPRICSDLSETPGPMAGFIRLYVFNKAQPIVALLKTCLNPWALRNPRPIYRTTLNRAKQEISSRESVAILCYEDRALFLAEPDSLLQWADVAYRSCAFEDQYLLSLRAMNVRLPG